MAQPRKPVDKKEKEKRENKYKNLGGEIGRPTGPKGNRIPPTYGGAKNGKTIKKAQGGAIDLPPSKIQSTNQKIQSNMNKSAMKNTGNSRVGTAKSGKSMKTCKGGC